MASALILFWVLILGIFVLSFLYAEFGHKKAKVVSNLPYMNLGAMNRSGVLAMDQMNPGISKRAMHLAGRGPWLILIALLVVALLAFAFTGSLLAAALILAISIPVLLFSGFKAFKLYGILNATPTERLGSSPIGLGEFQVKLATNQSQYLVSPISKQKCSYFILQLHQVQQRGKSSVDVILGTVQKGIPTMLADDSGFAVLDFSRAEMDLTAEYWIPKLTQEAGGIIQRFMDYVPEARQYLAMIGNSDGKTDIGSSDTHIVFRPGKGRLYFLEGWVPLGADYYAVGTVSPLDQDVAGKPMKRLIADKQYGIMSVLPESKARAMSIMKEHMVLCWGLAVVVTLFLAWLAGTGAL